MAHGPTMPLDDARALLPDAIYLPPAAQADVLSAMTIHRPDVIALIDGVFGQSLSVWHKEIMFVIAQGAEVVGAASTGALRAAELAPYGMRGIGNIYRLYRRAAIADDDEVCVTHAIEELDFMPLSEPMISIRYTLRDLRHQGSITKAEETAVAAALKAMHFSERTLDHIRAAIAAQMSPARAATVSETYMTLRRDAKGDDGKRLLEWLSAPRRPEARPDWDFPRTVHWVHQFEDRIDDVPGLGEKPV